MLDERRKNYVTASQAHRIMAGFEAEIAGKRMDKPVMFNELQEFCNGKKPKVGDLKKLGITASGKEIDSVCRYTKATTPVFSDGMWSVAREIAMYSFLDQRDEQYLSKDMERGNIQEEEAISVLSAHVGKEFSCTGGEQVFFHGEHLGVTPDGVEYDNFEVTSCAEVKNPKDTTHMKYLCMLKDQDDMLKVCPEYYWQAQTGMAVTGARKYHWASYHNGFKNDYRLVYIKVTPVKDHIDILLSRGKMVVEAVPKIIKKIKNRL